MCEPCVRWCEAVAGTPGEHERECPACGAKCRTRVPPPPEASPWNAFPWSELLLVAMVLGGAGIVVAAHVLGGK